MHVVEGSRAERQGGSQGVGPDRCGSSSWRSEADPSLRKNLLAFISIWRHTREVIEITKLKLPIVSSQGAFHQVFVAAECNGFTPPEKL